MVYLGPIEPRSLRVKNPGKPSEVRSIAQISATHPLGEGEEIPEHSQSGFVERRKENRRQNNKSPLLETRAGKDRRKGNSVINVSV